MAGYREPVDTNGVGPPAPDPNNWQPSGTPKSTQSAATPSWADYGTTEPANDKAIAIAYGTCKVTAVLIEHAAPTASNPPNWYAQVQYPVGQFIYANGNTYQATASTGISAPSGSGPSGNGTSIADGGMTWKFIQSGPASLWSTLVAFALCEGQVSSVLKLWWDQEIVTNLAAKDLLLATGGDNSELVNPPAGAAFWPLPWRYANTALLASSAVRTGTQKELPSSVAAEVKAIGPFDANGDVNPADIINDILTHSRRGLGWSASRVGDLTQYRTYCDAAGFHLSLLLDSQRTGLDVMTQLLTASNSDAIWSQAKLKVIPRGDTAITAPAFGAVNYTPSNASVATLTNADFLDPIQIQRRAEADSYNECPVSFISRADGYSEQSVSDPEVADIQRRVLAGAPNSGKNTAQTTQLGVIYPPSCATQLSRLWAQRNVQCRNTYTIKVGWRFILLEPTDIVTISDTVMGITNVPVRIVAIDEEVGSNGEGILTLTCEDWPAGVASALAWAPQAGDGYTPNQVGTGASDPAQSASTVALAGATGPVVNARLTSPPVDSAWPNGGSETQPPAGADTTGPEFAGILNAGAGAYSGSYVRQLSGTTAAPQIIGDLPGIVQVTKQSQLGFTMPAAPGDQFYAEAMVKAVVASTTGTDGCGIWIYFIDGTGAVLAGSYLTQSNPTQAAASAWTKTYFASIAAPAGTVKIKVFCWCDNNGTGTNTVQFDNLILRRAVAAGAIGTNAVQTTTYAQDGSGNPTAGARLSNDPSTPALKVAPGNLQIGTWVFDDGSNAAFWTRLKNALDNWNPDGQGNRTFYAGSTAHGGVPDINALRVWRTEPVMQGVTLGSYTATFFTINLGLYQSSLTQNLDGLRMIECFWYNTAGGWIKSTYHPIPDRHHSNNGYYVQTGPDVWVPANLSINSYRGIYVLCRLYGVYGFSAQKWFSSNAGSADWNGGDAPGGGPAPGGGGGSGGGGCPAPWVKVQLASGLWLPAGSLADGMKVRGFDQHDHRIVGKIGTVRRPRTVMKERFDIATADGKVTSFSHDHPIIVDGRGWTKVRDLRPGDSLPQIDGPPRIVKATKSIGIAPIVDFAVEGVHTYFADGFAHNALKS